MRREKLYKKGVLSFILLIFLFASDTYSQSNEDCLTCHEDEELTMEKGEKEISLYVNDKVLKNSPHNDLSCVSCHVGFDPDELPHKDNIQALDCKLCHNDAPIKHKFHPQMLKTGGINGTRDTSCKGCHGTHAIISPEVKGSKWYFTNYSQSCGTCHQSEKKQFITSNHSKAFEKGIEGAPNCVTCHQKGVSGLETGRNSADLKVVQEKLCLSCHLDDPDIRARTAPSAGFITAYEKSVHGSALEKGNFRAATCIDCHTSHNIKNGKEPSSSVFRENIPNTCGKCHSDITEEYKQSIHGVSALKGNKEAPVCTDCHGEHNILKHDNPEAPVAFKNVSQQVCSPCHSSVKLTEKYGIQSDRFKTFEDSYHGLALRGGSIEAANCASCHGAHNIKSSGDPTSMINKANLAETCGACHRGANQNFAIGKIHVTITEEDEPILYWIATTYILLIVVVIGGMLVHNVLDFARKSKIKKLKQRGYIKEEHYGHSLYLRMTVSERIQHLALTISFVLLVITGFMLRFPDTWWVEHIRDLSEGVFELRSIIHRICAVILITVSLYHIYYISFTKRGRKLVKDLFPVYEDIKEAVGVAKFNLGLSKEKPKLGRFSYIEKAEYWALLWGTIIMSVTGLIMWFDNTFIGIFTKLGWDIARTIHYYEAWLASLAIVVWHFYFVIFNPDVYPMNLSWITGTLTEEEIKHEHPREYEEISAGNVNGETKDDVILKNEDENEKDVSR
jgi:formate dehydrogenase gamma subunit